MNKQRTTRAPTAVSLLQLQTLQEALGTISPKRLSTEKLPYAKISKIIVVPPKTIRVVE